MNAHTHNLQAQERIKTGVDIERVGQFSYLVPTLGSRDEKQEMQGIEILTKPTI